MRVELGSVDYIVCQEADGALVLLRVRLREDDIVGLPQLLAPAYELGDGLWQEERTGASLSHSAIHGKNHHPREGRHLGRLVFDPALDPDPVVRLNQQTPGLLGSPESSSESLVVRLRLMRDAGRHGYRPDFELLLGEHALESQE